MKRVRISQLARETGLSRATIDRALNGRGGVHERTKRVIEDTLQRLSAQEATPEAASTAASAAEPGVDLVLRVGRGLLEQIKAARNSLGHRSLSIHDMYQRNEQDLLDQVRELCRDPGRPLILTAKNAEPLRAELVAARKRGKRVVTLVSDLGHDARDAFVGIDNRSAGQTAAFVIGGSLKHRAAMAGVVLGDYAFSCHEDREIGFRSNLRANFPSVQIADVAKGEDSPEQTYEAVGNLLAAHPALDAIYNVAGGNLGLARAVRESGRADQIRIVTHEANHITVPLIRSGLIDYVIAQDPLQLLTQAMALARTDGRTKEVHLLDFGLYTKFNLPSYGTMAASL
jgi:LacI family transcriptional regulator